MFGRSQRGGRPASAQLDKSLARLAQALDFGPPLIQPRGQRPVGGVAATQPEQREAIAQAQRQKILVLRDQRRPAASTRPAIAASGAAPGSTAWTCPASCPRASSQPASPGGNCASTRNFIQPRERPDARRRRPHKRGRRRCLRDAFGNGDGHGMGSMALREADPFIVFGGYRAGKNRFPSDSHRRCERIGPKATEGQPIQGSVRHAGLLRRLRLLAMTSARRPCLSLPVMSFSPLWSEWAD